jgi:hypothetical protein
MPRFLVTTRRADRGSTVSARDAVGSETGIKVVNADNPDMVTIDASDEAADRLRSKFGDTHYIEPEIRRSLQ